MNQSSVNQITDKKPIRTGLSLYKTGRSPYWFAQIWVGAEKNYRKSTKETSRIEAAKVAEEVFESLEREKVLLEFENHLRRNSCIETYDSNESFSLSRHALLKWAPVVDEFKIKDEEIVSNSINFKWLRVCQEFEKQMNFKNIELELSLDLPDLDSD